MKKYIYGFITGVAGVFAIGLIIAFSVMKLGLIPINADAQPPDWEKGLAMRAVDSSVARHAPHQTNPFGPTEETLIAGADIYKTECARCHGQASGRPSTFGASFYPPVPQLPGHASDHTEAELFWLVKHGVRNTSMPASGSTLSDNDIWQVVALIKRFDSLPPTVTAELNKKE